MPEHELIDPNTLPLTIDSLAEQFVACGLAAGQTVIVHTRMSALGWVAGGAEAIIHALLRVLTPEGTLMMPAFSPNNTDPANWRHPPVPESWWQVIRDHSPPYDPRTTQTWGLGKVPELFRTFPGVLRSAHPEASFAAVGRNAEYLLADHTSLTHILDDASPLGKLYALDGHVFMLGIDYSTCTSLHLAEYRANIPRTYKREGSAMLIDGVRTWLQYDLLDLNDEDFAQLGTEYEAANGIAAHRVGKGEAHFVRMRPLVDYAVGWLEARRGS
jgi:aminoglycoside 3-N-acetyltransferase